MSIFVQNNMAKAFGLWHPSDEDLEKAINRARCHIEVITDKNGHQKRVWVRNDKKPIGNPHVAQQEEKKVERKPGMPEMSAKAFNAADYKKKACEGKIMTVDHVYSTLNQDPKLGKDAAEPTKRAIYRLEKQMREGKETIKFYKPNGKWTKERKALHEKALEKIFTPEVIERCKPKNGEAPKFVMLGGRGGSGKSWFTDKDKADKQGRKVMFDKSNYLVIDVDELKKYCNPPYNEKNGWNAGLVHEESSYLGKMVRRMAFKHGLNIIIDGTMDWHPKNPRKAVNEFKKAKGLGYRTEAHYMFLSADESTRRAIYRRRNYTGDPKTLFKGRLVPPKVLLGMQDNEKTFESVKNYVDDWSFRDNNVPYGEQPRLIAQKGINY